ncbi:hypothetical protein COOONC_25593 [Cooperia oncophora]
MTEVEIRARRSVHGKYSTQCYEVKIGDFGLSRSGTSYRMKAAKKMPIKWMAPETMTNFTFTQKTDVYSYGVLIYEIFSGVEPYEGVTNTQTKKMVGILRLPVEEC